MKLETLVNAAISVNPAIPAPLQKLVNTNIPIEIAFTLGNFIKAVEPILASYRDAHRKLVMKYGEETENKKQTKVKHENLGMFMHELQKVHDREVEIPTVPEIKIGDLSGRGIDMTSHEMAMLTPWLITE